MSRKPVIPPYLLHDNKSLATSFNSTAVTLNTATRLAFNVATASVTDNTGTFAVQHRVYKDANTYSEWAGLTLDSVPTLANTNDQFMIDLDVPPGQVRLAFTAAGGTPNGTCDIWVTGEGK